ncbi:MAG: hypothetical protein LBC95_02770 [Candidatus Nomurabacteria bacterium]|jgi:hypothetical protein|nr:hypothetical protein [Candidatus Nomurabacteria bacterium]
MREKFINLVARHTFPFMILAAVLVAAILTTISITIYISSGAANIDLSRSGYESVRENIIESEEDEAPFPVTGAIDAAAVEDFIQRANKLQVELDKMNDFGGEPLDDAALNLNENE